MRRQKFKIRTVMMEQLALSEEKTA